jgi:hypothetical protein
MSLRNIRYPGPSGRAAVAALLLLASACSGSPAPKPLDSIADGFHKTLPSANARIVVWGNHPAVANSAITWFQKHGLTVLERARLKQILDEQTVRLTHSSDDEAQVLRVGQLMGADLVAFFDTSSTQGTQANMSFSMFGAAGADFQSLYRLGVAVRGVHVESSEVTWSGSARFPQATASLDEALAQLTCQALNAAWGLPRPGSGQPMC